MNDNVLPGVESYLVCCWCNMMGFVTYAIPFGTEQLESALARNSLTLSIQDGHTKCREHMQNNQNTWFNLAVVTGKLSGVVVIEITPQNDGIQQWYSFTKQLFINGKWIPIFDTFVIISEYGGYHHYYLYDERTSQLRTSEGYGRRDNSAGGSDKYGINVKSDGGYIISPYSITTRGKHYLPIATGGQFYPDDFIYDRKLLINRMPDHIFQLLMKDQNPPPEPVVVPVQQEPISMTNLEAEVTIIPPNVEAEVTIIPPNVETKGAIISPNVEVKTPIVLSNLESKDKSNQDKQDKIQLAEVLAKLMVTTPAVNKINPTTFQDVLLKGDILIDSTMLVRIKGKIWISSENLYSLYSDWCRKMKGHPYELNWFTHNIKTKNFEPYRNERGGNRLRGYFISPDKYYTIRIELNGKNAILFEYAGSK